MNNGAPSLASIQPQVLQVQHEELCTPSTATRPPYSPASPVPRARTLRSLAGANSTPRAQLRDLLSSLTALLTQEYRYVFNHNLGVRSGTGFAEDLQARRMLALCKRAYTLMTTHAATCIPAFHQFANMLGEEMYNQVLYMFDMFGMEELTDFIRMTKPRLTSKLALDYTVSLRTPAAQAPANILTTAASLGPLKQNSMAHSLKKKLKPFKAMPAIRMQQLVAAGCPILHIASRIAEDKMQRAQMQPVLLDNSASRDSLYAFSSDEGEQMDRLSSSPSFTQSNWRERDISTEGLDEVTSL